MAEIERNQLKRGRRLKNDAVLNHSESKVGEIEDPTRVLNDSFAQKHNERIAANSKNDQEETNNKNSKAHNSSRVQKTTSVDAIESDVNNTNANDSQYDIDITSADNRSHKQSRPKNNNSTKNSTTKNRHETSNARSKDAGKDKNQQNYKNNTKQQPECACECCCKKIKCLLCKMWKNILGLFKTKTSKKHTSNNCAKQTNKPNSKRNNRKPRYNNSNTTRK